jgi:hypothetical protein
MKLSDLERSEFGFKARPVFGDASLRRVSHENGPFLFNKLSK